MDSGDLVALQGRREFRAGRRSRWLNLSTEFIGTDARKYDTSSCSAVIPNEASDVPALLAGGTASYQVCMDVPPTAIEGGRVEVSESFSSDDVSAVWAVQ